MFFSTLSLVGAVTSIAIGWSKLPPPHKSQRLLVDLFPNPAKPGSLTPNVTETPDQNVILSWLEPQSSGLALKFAVRHQMSWGPVHTVASRQSFARYAEAPASVTTLGNGTLLAIWTEEMPSGGQWPGAYLYSSVSHDEGNTWSESHILHSDRSKSDHSFASVASLGPHSATIVWLDARDYSAQNRYRLMTATIDESGSVSPEQTLDDDVCTCCPTSLVRLNDDLYAAYRDHTSDNIRDIAIAREHAGKWSVPSIVHPDHWQINACPVNGPALAQDGSFLAIGWYTAAKGVPTVQFAISPDQGRSFLPPINLGASAGTGKPVGRISATGLNGHGVILTWLQQQSADETELLATFADKEGRIRRPTIVTKGEARSLGYPHIQSTGNGALLSWGGAGDKKIVHTAFLSLP